jgi:DNA-binding transcriptional LysR family regulator
MGPAMRDWDCLRFILALARQRSPEAAGRMLKVDESTVRRRVAALEKETGAALFERSEGLWQPTRAGAVLVEYAEAMEDMVASAEARLDVDDPMLAGTVRIGAPEGIGSILYAPALARLQRKWPQLMIELVAHDSPADIARREVDVLVILDPPGSGPYRIRKLRSVTLNVFGSREYLAESPPLHTVADLAAHRFIGYDPISDYAGSTVRKLADIGIAMRPGFVCSSVLGQTRAAAAGAGLALLPQYMIEDGLGLEPVLAEQVSVTVELWLLIHADVAPRARVRAVVDALVAA